MTGREIGRNEAVGKLYFAIVFNKKSPVKIGRGFFVGNVTLHPVNALQRSDNRNRSPRRKSLRITH